MAEGVSAMHGGLHSGLSALVAEQGGGCCGLMDKLTQSPLPLMDQGSLGLELQRCSREDAQRN